MWTALLRGRIHRKNIWKHWQKTVQQRITKKLKAVVSLKDYGNTTGLQNQNQHHLLALSTIYGPFWLGKEVSHSPLALIRENLFAKKNNGISITCRQNKLFGLRVRRQLCSIHDHCPCHCWQTTLHQTQHQMWTRTVPYSQSTYQYKILKTAHLLALPSGWATKSTQQFLHEINLTAPGSIMLCIDFFLNLEYWSKPGQMPFNHDSHLSTTYTWVVQVRVNHLDTPDLTSLPTDNIQV